MKFSVGWTVVAVSFVVLATSFAYRNLLQLTMTDMEAELGEYPDARAARSTDGWRSRGSSLLPK